MLIVIALVSLETTIGNAGFWQTCMLSPIEKPLHTRSVGLQTLSDNTQIITDSSNAGWRTTNTNQVIRSIGFAIPPTQNNTARHNTVERNSTQNTTRRTDIDADAQYVAQPLQQVVHVRIDIQDTHNQWHTGNTQLVDLSNPSTSVLPQNNTQQPVQTVAVHIVEAQETRIPLRTITLNAKVPFSISWLRLALGAIVALLILAFRPRSPLWHTPITESKTAQTRIIGVVCITALVAIVHALSTAWWSNDQSFHHPNAYTYDFNQYAHVAQALLAGHAWLDLPVPPEFAQLANPYNPQARNVLLAQGVQPIYWDYAFYNGHWYSYFGIIPALLYFVPFQWGTSLFISGGLALPATVAATISSMLALVGLALLIIRISKLYAPNTSVATVALGIITISFAGGAWYLYQRRAFYEVAFATGLMFLAWGLWFWLGAKRSDEYGNPKPVSTSHMIAGCICIASTLGCRVPMIAAACLWLVIFAPEYRSGLLLRPIAALLLPKRWLLGAWKSLPLHKRSSWHTWRIDSAILVSVAAVFTPILVYNDARFGAILDFGNAYQITVNDMLHRHTTLSSLWQIIQYYLFIPPHFTSYFPFVSTVHTPIEPWQYADTIVAGLCWLTPAILIPLALPLMWHSFHRTAPATTQQRGYDTSHTMFVFASVLWILGSIEFFAVAWAAGLDWRYITDFAWYWLLSAYLVLLIVEQRCSQRLYCVLFTGMVLLCLVSVACSAMQPLVNGHTMSLSREHLDTYMQIYSWFTWL